MFSSMKEVNSFLMNNNSIYWSKSLILICKNHMPNGYSIRDSNQIYENKNNYQNGSTNKGNEEIIIWDLHLGIHGIHC